MIPLSQSDATRAEKVALRATFFEVMSRFGAGARKPLNGSDGAFREVSHAYLQSVVCHRVGVPELHLPLRVGLAFLPARNGRFALDASQQEQLLERIRLSEEVRRLWIEKFGIRVLEGYGVAECAPVTAVNVPMACRSGSVGKLVPGMEYELKPVPGIDRGGVLHVKGPNLMKGCFLHEQPGVVQWPKSVREGWYSTGDIVFVDEDDFVHIRGRVKRFAKIAGEMISLEEVERIAAASAPGFAHAASTRTDPAKGEAIANLLIPRLPPAQPLDSVSLSGVQERGHATVGAGHSVAVQNLAEYSSMLLLIGLYTLAVRAGMPITTLVAVFGGLLSIAMGALWTRRWRGERCLA